MQEVVNRTCLVLPSRNIQRVGVPSSSQGWARFEKHCSGGTTREHHEWPAQSAEYFLTPDAWLRIQPTICFIRFRDGHRRYTHRTTRQTSRNRSQCGQSRLVRHLHTHQSRGNVSLIFRRLRLNGLAPNRTTG